MVVRPSRPRTAIKKPRRRRASAGALFCWRDVFDRRRFFGLLGLFVGVVEHRIDHAGLALSPELRVSLLLLLLLVEDLVVLAVTHGLLHLRGAPAGRQRRMCGAVPTTCMLRFCAMGLSPNAGDGTKCGPGVSSAACHLPGC